MKLRVPIVERIWRVRGFLSLDEPMAPSDVFERLDPLFNVEGTQATDVAVDGDTLTYSKTNPAAQDKLSTFTSGVLRVEQDEGASRLSYELSSTALLLCFIAPLFFLGFAQLATFINELEKPAIAAEMAEEEKKKEEEAEAEEPLKLHWIDEMLGAPAPKQPGEDDEEEKAREGKEREGEEREGPQGNHSPGPAYVLAGIFFVIFCVGRVLEPYLVKRTFRAHLRPPESSEEIENDNEMMTSAKLASPPGGGEEIQ